MKKIVTCMLTVSLATMPLFVGAMEKKRKNENVQEIHANKKVRFPKKQDLALVNFIKEIPLEMEYNSEEINNQLKQVAKFVIEDNIDLEICDERGDTALMHAVHFGRKEIVSFLLENGANINTQNNFQDTPLRCAMRNGSLCEPGFVKMLIDNGANCYHEASGKTILDEFETDTISSMIRLRNNSKAVESDYFHRHVREEFIEAITNNIFIQEGPSFFTALSQGSCKDKYKQAFLLLLMFNKIFRQTHGWPIPKPIIHKILKLTITPESVTQELIKQSDERIKETADKKIKEEKSKKWCQIF